MSEKYNPTQIENKWRQIWQENNINPPDESKPKFYCLDMFPYPSGSGLHVGHWRGYVISDVLSRYKIMQGFCVLHPMGWDAFGLPAENYAIKEGKHPEVTTAASVAQFKRQLSEISAVYDWSREVNTTDPKYYKWTQWIFSRMFKAGLAYEKEMPLNWCPSCCVVLANEEATDGTCERCGGPVTKKNLRQWMLKITQYAERLLADLDLLDWPEKVKKMQADWIGKSYGAEIDFALENHRDKAIKVFTTRPDTLFGATFMVLAPEHQLVSEITTDEHKTAVEEYVQAASQKSNVDRMASRDKTGVFTGSYAINPINGKRCEVWISDYVLAGYGTGAIMCVPAHDQRDFEFATKFGLPIVQVISNDGKTLDHFEEALEAYGTLVNSGRYNGMTSDDAKEAITANLAERGIGNTTINYKLRDWVFSRQRYWGEPIPIVHCPDCGAVVVPDDQLPVTLPKVDSYKPTQTGESPLAAITEWVNTTCPVCGKPAKRETNTMPQWAGSSWYFLRYADVNNDKELISKEAMESWLPVNYYLGGIEHAVLHLLYARFYTKFLYDIGVVNFTEPFTKLFNQGMVNKDGVKMSKSMGNVVSPDELVQKYGCDSLRMYELFIGPPELDCEWDDRGIDGVFRFLNKVYKLVAENQDKLIESNRELEQARHKMAMEISRRLDTFSLNTVVSGFMEFTTRFTELARKYNGLDRESIETIVRLLAPFVPHLSEELWSRLGHAETVFKAGWPTYDAEKAKDDMIVIAIQMNGKLRGDLEIDVTWEKDKVLELAKAKLGDKLSGATIVKEIYVPGKIVNFVVK